MVVPGRSFPCFVMGPFVLFGLVSDLSRWPMALLLVGLQLLRALLCLPGSVQVRHRPSCFSDYLSTSTCEWRMGSPINCSSDLRLTYQLVFLYSE